MYKLNNFFVFILIIFYTLGINPLMSDSHKEILAKGAGTIVYIFVPGGWDMLLAADVLETLLGPVPMSDVPKYVAQTTGIKEQQKFI